MQKNISLGGREIAYELTYKPVKNINLRILSGGEIRVSAAPRVSVREIERFLHEKEMFILSALQRVEKRNEVQEDVLPLYAQKTPVVVVPGRKNSAEFKAGLLIVTLKDVVDDKAKEKQVEKWLSQQAKIEFDALCRAAYPTFARLGVAYPAVRVRAMTSRWGTCHVSKKILTFNTRLLFAPPKCREYVVCHEFTHFLQSDHSQAFYRLMDTFMPDWHVWRKALADVPTRIHKI